MDRLKRRRDGRVTGLKETAKRLESGLVEILYVADDADRALTDPMVEAAREQGIEIVRVPSMKELGRASGIEVGAAVAAVLKEGESRADH